MLCVKDREDDEFCDFFEAGPLLTPGFKPVWVFGELEPLLLLEDDDEDVLRIDEVDAEDDGLSAREEV